MTTCIEDGVPCARASFCGQTANAPKASPAKIESLIVSSLASVNPFPFPEYEADIKSWTVGAITSSLRFD
jgi:hypothetical protein